MSSSYNQSNWRGGRGRGSGYRGGKPQQFVGNTPIEPDRDLLEGLVHKALRTLEVPTVSDKDDYVEIKDYKFIGSYNWTEQTASGKARKPTIIVPGSPPQWKDMNLPYQVPADVGIHYVDQNGFRLRRAVLLPLFAAVQKCTEISDRKQFDWQSVDFVTDRNNLRKLTRWVARGPKSFELDFRIDVQLVGKKTILLSRWSERFRENFNGFTYGFNFEKKFSNPAPGCENSTGHHRIVTYNLNGLKMVVRFEVDACLPSLPSAKVLDGSDNLKASGASDSSDKVAKPSLTNLEGKQVGKASDVRDDPASVDDLVSALAAVSVKDKSIQSDILAVREGGSEVPAASIIELTTRSYKFGQYNFDWNNAFPQLFFSQTSHHFLGLHNRGTITAIEKRDVAEDEELQAIEQTLQPDFKKLRKALDLISDVVMEYGPKARLSLVCKKGVLSVHQRANNESILPDDAAHLFDA